MFTQKALEGSETDTRKLLKEIKENLTLCVFIDFVQNANRKLHHGQNLVVLEIEALILVKRREITWFRLSTSDGACRVIVVGVESFQKHPWV